MVRLSFGLRPSSQALRAWTITAAAPAAATAVDQREQRLARLLLVDADAAFDGDGNVDRRRHRRDAFGDQRRLAHQAGAEAAVLHPVGRAAAIEVDLVVAEIGADARRLGEPRRLRAAELQRDRMLDRVEADQPLARAEHAPRRRSPSRYRAARAASAGDGRPGNAGRSNPSSARRRSASPKGRLHRMGSSPGIPKLRPRKAGHARRFGRSGRKLQRRGRRRQSVLTCDRRPCEAFARWRRGWFQPLRPERPA